MMIPPRRSVTRSHPPRVSIPTPGCGRGRPRSALGVQSAGLEARKRARAIAIRHDIHRRGCAPFHEKTLRVDPRPRPRPDAAGTPSRSRVPNAEARRRRVARLTRASRRANGRRDPQCAIPSRSRRVSLDASGVGGVRLPRLGRARGSAPPPDLTSERRSRRGADTRGARAPPRLPRITPLVNTALVSPSSHPSRNFDPSRRTPDRRAGQPRLRKSRDATVDTPRAPRGGGTLGDAGTPQPVPRARGEGANVTYITIAPAPSRAESLGGDPAPPRGWMGPPRRKNHDAPACPSNGSQALLGEPRRGLSRRIAGGTSPPWGPVPRAKESVDSPSRGELHLPVRGRPRARGAGTGRASRRARCRGRLP